MTDQADNDMAAWDREEQAAEARDMAIESRMNGLWENKDDVVRIIDANMMALHRAWLEDYDGEKVIREFIDGCFRMEAIGDLNL